MRKLILLAVLPMACIVSKATAHEARLADSAKIIHANDGDISEWGSGRFETDPELKVLYAVDHDQEFMYMAMKVVDPAMQMRIAMSGMKLFIDTRGKKKEGTGVEFPVRRNRNRGGFNGSPGGDPQDKEKIRDRMAENMLVLKTFGFYDKEDKTQFINQPGGVTIAYDWDANGNLAIEYKVPLNYVDDISSLKNKTMSIGWKINEAAALPAPDAGPTAATGAGASGGGRGGRGGGGRGGGGSRSGAIDMGGQQPAEADPKGQFIWTKHLMNF